MDKNIGKLKEMFDGDPESTIIEWEDNGKLLGIEILTSRKIVIFDKSDSIINQIINLSNKYSIDTKNGKIHLYFEF